jgi:Mg2+-importing ATPase
MTDSVSSANPYWSLDVEAVTKNLNSSLEGLNADEAAKRLTTYGPNLLETRKKATPLKLFLAQFNSPIVLILLFATVLSAVLQDWLDAIIILGIILVSAILSFVQEFNANNAAEKLRSQVTVQVNVEREGKIQTVPAAEVVPGDIVLLSAGSLIPADGLVLEATDFFVNQAVLTGETYPVEKKPGMVPEKSSLAERTNMVFMGTSASSGSARALIVQTGTASVFGQIAERLELRPPETEFERGIRKFGYLLSEVTLILVIAVFAVNVFFKKPVLDSFLFSIALAVGLTPQLLPAIININLSKGSQAMAKRGVIVRRLASIENFGSMDVLCTDKTGTLTLGVVKLDGALDVDGQPSDSVFREAFLNSHFQTGMVNALDDAVMGYAQPDISNVTKIDEVPYDFVRKRLSVVVKEGNVNRVVTKGALNKILESCTLVDSPNGPVPLDNERRSKIDALFTDWSGQGFRVLGVAHREAEEKDCFGRECEANMTFIGFLLFFDPPKPEVKEVIQQLEDIGVSLKIITGDNKLAAMHTAQAVGLQVTGVVTGAELNDLRDEALLHKAENANLFVEVDPNQKERILLAVAKMGHVVGYMGDGINDAPSLHAADVGISVDTAVDVAKEAADFVLLKNDLGVLREGIIQGRMTFANTLKYVFMATSANFGNMFSVAGASLFLPFLPMLPKQVLLINLFTDLPEMTIAGDNVDPVMINQPRRWDINFIRRFMVTFGLLSSVFDYLTFGVLYLLLGANLNTAQGQMLFHAGWFVESVLSATLVVFAVRTRLPFTSSRPSRAMMAVTALVMLATLLIPFTPLARLMEFVTLPPLFLLAVIAIVLVYFASAEFTKRRFYAREK